MRVFGLLGVVVVLCVGLYLYQQDIKQYPNENPVQQIDTVAIRQRLLTIGQTERQYQVTNGKFATLEELAAADLLPGGTEQRATRTRQRSAPRISRSPQHRPLPTRKAGRHSPSTTRWK